jgi:ribosomal protein RSM22 (predicted rRNA methylase)
MQIPSELRAALDGSLEGVSRGTLKERAERMSSLYRDKANSTIAVRDATDALAYAVTRSPSTYGAVRNVLERLQVRNPEFNPTTALDLATGTGAASWAVSETWPNIESITQVDCNRPLLSLNQTLAQQASCNALRNATQIVADLTRGLEAPSADLVVLSYMLVELSEAQIRSVLNAAWERSTGAIVIVEPGTPVGYQQIQLARHFLLNSGGRILLPCPHEQACPLVPPDWCHFVQRIERSRDHRILKSAELPYEDEKFSYLVAMREPYFVPAEVGRILTRPEREGRAITVKLCKLDGTADLARISAREKQYYARAKKKEWGDEL